MPVKNFISTKHKEICLGVQGENEFTILYSAVENKQIREIFSTLHQNYNSLFRKMNERLPTYDDTSYFWAEPSRQLIHNIEITLELFNSLKNTQYAFDIDSYYFELIKKCRDFLSSSNGSIIPNNMAKVDLYYTIPIFQPSTTITVQSGITSSVTSLKAIGGGSYANVFKYKDEFYNKTFAVKKAKKDLDSKEMERFKREFELMKQLSSPYILEVYCYDDVKNEYIMEYMDITLDDYISKNNSKLSDSERKVICGQILKAFKYIHEKKMLHRDISPKNILLKKYDDVKVIKLADFGLVKIPNSTLTDANTAFKGYFNDPALVVEGFDNYSIIHETYALTRIVYYVMTGKTSTDNIKNQKLQEFIRKGLSSEYDKRFQSVEEMIQAFRAI